MDQPDRIKELFLAAIELPAAERTAFLARACAGDAAMLAELTELLALHDDAGSFLAEPGGAVRAAVGTLEVAESAGETIGAYKLVERIGEGTFGTVWVAEQREPVRRAVALKILKAGMDSAQVVARFEQERQALALMAHPNIAQVFDAGTTPRGRPFFVMELVKGVPLTDYARQHELSLQARLELFVQVCRAVQHAHGKGVIHRDLKPGNVLVATADGRPLAKVIDFGVAKATGARLTEKTLLTEHRGMVGTLAYMSPEQAEGLLDVDTRSDVYSLGAMLYELLTGGTPFDVGALREQGLREVLRLLREVDPQRPSVRVSSKGVAAWAGGPGQAVVRGDAKALFGALRGDLDWVVLKALEKERARRYASADGLAEDVERYLAGDAVLAVPPSVGYRVRKFVRRHRVGVVAGVSVAVALVIGLVVAMWGLERATASEAELIVQKRGAELDAYRANLNGSLGLASGMQHASAQTALERCSERLRGWEWSYAAAQLADAPRMLHPNPLSWAICNDRERVAFTDGDSVTVIRIGTWDKEIEGSVDLKESSDHRIIMLYPHIGRILIMREGYHDGVEDAASVRVYDDKKGMWIPSTRSDSDDFPMSVETLMHDYTISTRVMVDSPVWECHVSGSEWYDDQVRDHEVFAGGKWRTSIARGLTFEVARPRKHVIGSRDRTLALSYSVLDDRFCAATRSEKSNSRFYPATGGFSSADSTIATMVGGGSLSSIFLACHATHIAVEDAATGKPTSTLTTDAASIQAIALSRDGDHAAACDPKHIRIWHLENPADVYQVPLSGPLPSTPILAVCADHVALATGNGIRLISIADPDRSLEHRLEHGATTSMQFEPYGARLLVGTSTGRALLLDTKTMTPTSELIGHQQPVRALAWNHDGSRAFTAGDDGTIRVWYTVREHDGKLALELLSLSESSIAGKPTCLLFPPDGERLICGYDDGSMRVWDSVSWSERVDRRNATAGTAGK